LTKHTLRLEKVQSEETYQLKSACPFTNEGFEVRQVVDIDIARIITEYRAQVLIDDHGKRFVASFPETVTRPIQYGSQIKAHSVYLSQFQLLPYKRIQDYFKNQLGIPLSTGSIVNFNLDAASRVVDSGGSNIIRQQLQQVTASISHACRRNRY
jgi:transposase